ncbi:MAG: hypothetical protein IT162_18445 [Bryobacterales bacterium]|nr:hypothetical protein [Bryobacterales bacterium]
MKFLACSLLPLALAAQTTAPLEFTTGQAARIVIGQPNFTAQDNNSNRLVVGGVGGVAYANDMLFVTDANRLQASPINHRVLLYRGVSGKFPSPTDELFPTTRCPVCIGEADVVLGQDDFVKLELQAPSSKSMRAPVGVATDGNTLVVADTDFNRVLIWNSSPQSNAMPADVVLGQPDFTRVIANEGQQNIPTNRSFRGPQGVWIQNGRLFVADTNNNRILIWNSIPRTNYAPADVVIGQRDFNTFVQPDITQTTIEAKPDNLLTPVAVTSDGTRMFVTDLGHNRVLIWNTIPRNNNQAADLVIGQPNLTEAARNNPNVCPSGEKDADGNDIILPRCEASLEFPRFALSDGKYLFVADGGNDRVLVFNQVPTQNGLKADSVLGQIGTRVNLISDSADPRGIASSGAVRTPQALAFDGRNLYVTDPFNRRIMVFTMGERKIPNSGVRNSASREIFAVGAITFSGEVKENQEPVIKIGEKEYKYKVKKDETFNSLIINLVNLINAGTGDPLVLATPNLVRGAIIFSARQAGEIGDTVALTTSLVENTDTALVMTTSGATLAGGKDAALIAPGTIVSLFGDKLSEVSASAPSDATELPLELGGVQVYFDGIRSPLYSVSPTEVRAQVPWEVLDTESVNAWVRTVKANGEVSVTTAVAVPIVKQNPGIFALEGTDEPRPGLVFHGSPNAVGTVSVDGSERVGDVATITIEDRSYTYTVATGDTLDTVQQNLINQINERDPRVEAVKASAFRRIRLRARVPGPDGNGIQYTASSREGDQVIMTATTGQLCCANSGPVTEENPALPGENIIVMATGLGLVKDGNKEFQNTGKAYNGPELNDPFEFVSSLAAGKTANVLSAGMKPGTVGVFEVVLELNSDIPTDPKTQLTIAQDVFVSNIVTFAVFNPNQAN